MWKLRKFTLTPFWQKICESNVFTREVTNELISRNIFSVGKILSFPHCDTVECNLYNSNSALTLKTIL